MLHESISKLHTALTECGISCETRVPLSRYTTFRIGGDAALGIFPKSEAEVLLALSAVKESGVSLFVIGGGSNLLCPDAGFPGVVLFTKGLSEISFCDAEDGSIFVTAGAGVTLSALSKVLLEKGLTGAEFLYGIPGTVGGAVVMNAGAYGGEIAQILHASRYADRNSPDICFARGLEAHRYGYRTSVYLKKPEELVLSATFLLRRGDAVVIENKMKQLLSKRKEKQPLDYPSAGSFFKRPTGTFAGKLIEDCGLKGTCVGGAEISLKHAGFIVNCGGATESDVRRLAAFVRETVLRETGFLLESEVRTMGGEPI